MQRQTYTDEQSFAWLYGVTHVSVYRYVYGLVGGHRQDAEDITAETFLSAWDSRHTFEGTTQHAQNWLFTIAKRRVIDRWRRQQARPAKVNIDDVPLPAFEASPEERAAFLEDQAILWALLRQLPQERREVLTLRYLLGWRVNRIADYLGKKPNTVSAMLRRTLESLRDQWPTETQGDA